MNRRDTLTMLGALGLTLSTGAARAATFSNFDQAAFDKLKAAKQPIILHIAATWCGECHEQRQALNKLEKKPEYKNLQIMTIDFDTQKDAMRKFGVSQRTTLIAFKDGKEVGRFTGDTRAATVEALMKKTI